MTNKKPTHEGLEVEISKRQNISPKKNYSLRKKAQEFIDKNPSAIKKIPPRDVKNLIEDLQIHQVELEMRNEEFRRTQLELEASRNQYSDLYDFAPVGYFSISEKGMILMANLTGATMLGLERSLMIGMPFSKFINKEDQNIYHTNRQKLLKTKIKQTCELKFIKEDGSQFDSQIESIPVLDADGNVNQFRSTVTDISERKRVEEKLQNEFRMRSILLDNIPDCIALSIKKGTREIVASNKFAQKLGAVPGLTCFKTCSMRDDKCPWCLAPKLWQTDQSQKTEIEYRGKWYEGLWAPLSKDLYVHYIFDITSRKQVENALRESEEKYKELVEGTDGLITKVDRNGNIMFVNHMSFEFFGVSHNDIIGMSAFDFLHPDDKKDTHRLFDDIIAKKETRAISSSRMVSKNGKIHYMHRVSNFHYDSQGNLSGITSIAHDITKRIEMEEALKKTHNELEQRVKERTEELRKTNEALNEKTINLQDVNTALKILLERREKDKEAIGERVLLNVKELLIPHINKLKRGPLNESQGSYIELLESGLQDIISPFAQKITSRYMHITPSEMKVANLVKEGRTSKEIAEMLNSTERAVVAHRTNLRKKLGLKKKYNLRTYLISFQ